MEVLEKLQAVHETMGLLQSHSLVSPHSSSSNNRFLADFVIFLVQETPAADLWPPVQNEISSEQVPNRKEIHSSSKVSNDMRLRERKRKQVSGSTPTNLNRVVGIKKCHEGSEEVSMPMVALKDMERGRSTLEDYCRSYFMFHGLDVHDPVHVFRHLPVLMFVESFIYQLDELNEDQLRLSSLPVGDLGLCTDNSLTSTEVDQINKSHTGSISETKDVQDTPTKNGTPAKEGARQFKGLGRDTFTAFQVMLVERGLMTTRIKEELKDGLQYWELEQSLCNAVSLGSQASLLNCFLSFPLNWCSGYKSLSLLFSCLYQIKVEDVIQAIQLKSFDYRVLNLLMYHLQNQLVDEVHFKFLSISELLVEISDDLFDYEEDVVNNSFNILRMFLYIYGSQEGPIMLAKFIGKAEEEYENLLQGLEPTLAAKYRGRCLEAVKEGGSKSKHVFGSWTIPPLIVDEEAYRHQVVDNISN
ncbi:unnamed protein product [Sphagnum jensenii]|uniref:Uncharacterized protein n=1 Tax=Sphagnum jensenii TaxID=128206 RepID=A0ABP0VVL0_9BRYO